VESNRNMWGSVKTSPGLGFNSYEMYYLLVLFSLSLSKSLAVNSAPKFLWIPGGLQVDSRWIPGDSRWSPGVIHGLIVNI
jgi:hypothetical protein